jgi:hypothetical protein
MDTELQRIVPPVDPLVPGDVPMPLNILWNCSAGETVHLDFLDEEASCFSTTKELLENMKFKGKYLVPEKPNWNDIDSVLAPNIAFQMTISLRHPYDQSRVLKQFGELESIAFVYVVPETIYDDFQFQNPKNCLPNDSRIRQFVMCVPDGKGVFFSFRDN